MLSDRIGLNESKIPFNRADPAAEWDQVQKTGKKPILHPDAFGTENKDPKETYRLRYSAAGSGPKKVINSMDSAVTSLKPTQKFPVRKSELYHSDFALDKDSDASKEIERRLEKVRNAMRKQDLANSHDSEI